MANVADTKLYDILGVPPGASDNELKKVARGPGGGGRRGPGGPGRRRGRGRAGQAGKAAPVGPGRGGRGGAARRGGFGPRCGGGHRDCALGRRRQARPVLGPVLVPPPPRAAGGAGNKEIAGSPAAPSSTRGAGPGAGSAHGRCLLVALGPGGCAGSGLWIPPWGGVRVSRSWSSVRTGSDRQGKGGRRPLPAVEVQLFSDQRPGLAPSLAQLLPELGMKLPAPRTCLPRGHSDSGLRVDLRNVPASLFLNAVVPSRACRSVLVAALYSSTETSERKWTRCGFIMMLMGRRKLQILR